MTEPHSELKNILEAALLVAGQPLTIDKMLSLFPEDSRPSRDDVRAALKHIENECAGRGIELMQVDQAFRFQTRPRYAEWISRLYEERPVRYSRALLETLAIIAYRQPVTRGEIEDIRGVAVSSEIIKTLMGRDWIRQVGTRDVPGRPALYGTTRGFLEHFSLKSLDELPPLAELRDVEKIAAELNLRLPVDETEGGAPAADAAAAGSPDDSSANDSATDEPSVADDGGGEDLRDAAGGDAGDEPVRVAADAGADVEAAAESGSPAQS
jgi:segregation and condensation protein B